MLEAPDCVRRGRSKNATDLTLDSAAEIEWAFLQNLKTAIRRALQRLLDIVERHEQLGSGDQPILLRKHFGAVVSPNCQCWPVARNGR